MNPGFQVGRGKIPDHLTSANALNVRRVKRSFPHDGGRMVAESSPVARPESTE